MDYYLKSLEQSHLPNESKQKEMKEWRDSFSIHWIFQMPLLIDSHSNDLMTVFVTSWHLFMSLESVGSGTDWSTLTLKFCGSTQIFVCAITAVCKTVCCFSNCSNRKNYYYIPNLFFGFNAFSDDYSGLAAQFGISSPSDTQSWLVTSKHVKNNLCQHSIFYWFSAWQCECMCLSQSQ